MTDEMPLCSECRFFSPEAQWLDGTCRFNPPDGYSFVLSDVEAVAVGDDQIEETVVEEWFHYVGWPEVRAEHWCGKFEQTAVSVRARSERRHPSQRPLDG